MPHKNEMNNRGTYLSGGTSLVGVVAQHMLRPTPTEILS